MKIRPWAVAAVLTAAVVMLAATAGAAAVSVRSAPKSAPAPHAALGTEPLPLELELPRSGSTVRGGVLSGTAPSGDAEPMPQPPAAAISGIASNYAGTAGWIGQATVALPGDLGGRYTGEVNGFVTVCADRCARLPVVDWCECYWATDDERIVDLSHPAWVLVSDEPLETGLTEVRLVLER